MVEKPYKWRDGAELGKHSRRKHKILREYTLDYLMVRCRNPHRRRFRLAIIDGFAGGGGYQDGTPGSPIIFIEVLKNAIETVNAGRLVQRLGPIEIECLLILNDKASDAIELLKTHVTPMEREIIATLPKLNLQIHYLNLPFELAYPEIKKRLLKGKYSNVLFNLDQSGHSHVERKTIQDIMHSYRSVEVFYTFMISSLLAFLDKSNPDHLRSQLAYLGLSNAELQTLVDAASVKNGIVSREAWLGAAERLVFDELKKCAPYVSPFSINNPDGWKYWFVHFANVFRARQVYNNILHDNSSAQAHYGRFGLNMLAYDPSHEGLLYLFDPLGRDTAKNQLLEDIPRFVADAGRVIPLAQFYETIYNATPAHADDVHSAIIDNPDLEVITPAGGERRRANTIAADDILRIKPQTSFFPMFRKR